MWASRCFMGPVNSSFKTNRRSEGLEELFAESVKGTSNATSFKQPFLHLTELECKGFTSHVHGLGLDLNGYCYSISRSLVEGFVCHGDSQQAEIRHVSLKDECKRFGDYALDSATWVGVQLGETPWK